LPEKLLAVDGINVGYGDVQILWDLSLEVYRGEIVVILGPNGVGKTTTLKAISGLLQCKTGSIKFNGQELTRLDPHKVAELGIAHVPEGRRVFPQLTVLDNLYLGAYAKKARGSIGKTLQYVFELFPILHDRSSQMAGTLSGGEQQMLAIGRGLMSLPDLIMLDEPSLGLMPKIVTSLFQVIQRINQSGMTVVLVEQNVQESLAIAHRYYLLETGRVALHGQSSELMEHADLRSAYLGM